MSVRNARYAAQAENSIHAPLVANFTTAPYSRPPGGGRSMWTPRYPGNVRAVWIHPLTTPSNAASRPARTVRRMRTVTGPSCGVPTASMPRLEPDRVGRLLVDHRVGVLDPLPVRP